MIIVVFIVVSYDNNKVNRICNEMLDCACSPLTYLLRNWRAVTWVSNYNCPVSTFSNWNAHLRHLRHLRCARVIYIEMVASGVLHCL